MRIKPPIESKEDLVINISNAAVKNGVAGDACFCVIAEGTKETLWDKGIRLLGAQIGTERAVLYLPGNHIIYNLSSALKRAVRYFDKHGKWVLAPGEYRLLAVAPSKQMKVRAAYDAKRKQGRSGIVPLPGTGRVRKHPVIRIGSRDVAFTRTGQQVALGLQA